MTELIWHVLTHAVTDTTPAGAFSLPYVSGNGVSGAQNSEDYPGNDTESRKAGPIDRRGSQECFLSVDFLRQLPAFMPEE